MSAMLDVESLGCPPVARVYQPEKLNERHREILRMKLTGMSNSDIAQALGITTMTVGYVVHGELGKSELGALENLADGSAVDARQIINEAAPEAAALLVDVMKGNELRATFKQRLDAAGDVLDRAGVARMHRVEGKFLHGHARLTDILDTARELGYLREPSIVPITNVG